MTMSDDFCVFILTNGRPGRVQTIRTLARCGYTGKIYIVIDDEDQSGEEYIKEFGDKVLIFSKDKIAETFDQGGVFNDRRSIVYARNVCFELADKVGCTYFMQLDDDYQRFVYRFNGQGEYSDALILSLDEVFGFMLDYYKAIPAASIALAQTGDYIGGEFGSGFQQIKTLRKAMNSFICSTDRPFKFSGLMNEDVNTYVGLGRQGKLFLTVYGIGIQQKVTQREAGGMSEFYKDIGTYVKSFYTVMYAPSCVRVHIFPGTQHRLQHTINWRKAVPRILHEKHRKTEAA